MKETRATSISPSHLLFYLLLLFLFPPLSSPWASGWQWERERSRQSSKLIITSKLNLPLNRHMLDFLDEFQFQVFCSLSLKNFSQCSIQKENSLLRTKVSSTSGCIKEASAEWHLRWGFPSWHSACLLFSYPKSQVAQFPVNSSLSILSTAIHNCLSKDIPAMTAANKLLWSPALLSFEWLPN